MSGHINITWRVCSTTATTPSPSPEPQSASQIIACDTIKTGRQNSPS